jgi:hypothetical protein
MWVLNISENFVFANWYNMLAGSYCLLFTEIFIGSTTYVNENLNALAPQYWYNKKTQF